ADLSPLLKELRELSEAQVELPPLIAQTGKMTSRERESRARLYEASLLIGQSVMGEVAAELAHRQKHLEATASLLPLDPERYRQLLRTVQESERELALQISLGVGAEKKIKLMFDGLERLADAPVIPGRSFTRLERSVFKTRAKLSRAAVTIEREGGVWGYLWEIDLAKKPMSIRAYPAEELFSRLDVAEGAALHEVERSMARKLRETIAWSDRLGRLTAKDLTEHLAALQSAESLELIKGGGATTSGRVLDLLALDARSHLIGDAREVREFRAELRAEARTVLAASIDHRLEQAEQRTERGSLLGATVVGGPDPHEFFSETFAGARTLVSTGLLTAAEAVEVLQAKDPNGRFPKAMSAREPLRTFITDLLPDLLKLVEKGSYITTSERVFKDFADRMTAFAGNEPTDDHRIALTAGLEIYRDALLSNGKALEDLKELRPLVEQAVLGSKDRFDKIFYEFTTAEHNPGLTPDAAQAELWERIAAQYRGAGLGMVLDGRIGLLDLAGFCAEGALLASSVDGGRAYADLVDVFMLNRPETGYATEGLNVLAAAALRSAAEDLPDPRTTDRTRRRLDFLESVLMEQGRDSGLLVEAAALIRDDLDWAGRSDASETDVLERLDRMSGAGLRLVSEGLMDIEQFGARLDHLAGFRHAGTGSGPDFEARIEGLRQRAVYASVEHRVGQGTNIHLLNAGDMLLQLIKVADGLTSAEAGPYRVEPEALFALTTRMTGLSPAPKDSHFAQEGVFGMADAVLRYHTAEPGPAKEAAFEQWFIALEGFGIRLLDYDPGLASWA
ncbi:hypothetical protein, partial [Kitasatospora sp. NPDC093102]|uniref:hypothetical protein n=1 Tax=Kitasatospora sp. NPDC093102 TaxID=3155069 RepID=UPI00342FAC41